MTCPDCDGSGKIHSHNDTCGTCDRKGVISDCCQYRVSKQGHEYVCLSYGAKGNR